MKVAREIRRLAQQVQVQLSNPSVEPHLQELCCCSLQALQMTLLLLFFVTMSCALRRTSWLSNQLLLWSPERSSSLLTGVINAVCVADIMRVAEQRHLESLGDDIVR
jgi:hypothetical protein